MTDVFSLRLPRAAIARLRRAARARRTGATTLAREWILERLDEEPPRGAREASPPYGTAPSDHDLRARAGEVAAICRRRGVRRLALFGSAVGPRFDAAHSDIDVAATFGDMPPGVRAEAYFGLIEDLERLTGRPVDVVEPASLENPYFRGAIEREHVVLYAE